MSDITMIEKFWFDRNEIDGYAELETNEPWFHAGQVCKILSLTNPTESLRIHTDKDERRKVDGKVLGKLQDTWYVSESGLYGLILAAKNEKGKSFKRWIKREVLPNIRKYGCYISPDATSTQLETLQDRIKAQMAAIEVSYQICKESRDERGIITLKSQLLNLTNRLDGKEESEYSDWLSISEILEKKFKLHTEKARTSLSSIGKLVKTEYEIETGLKVVETPKRISTGHKSETIKVYPPDWFDRIENISISYWQTSKWATTGKGLGVWEEVNKKDNHS